jgi:hypothetical protein
MSQVTVEDERKEGQAVDQETNVVSPSCADNQSSFPPALILPVWMDYPVPRAVHLYYLTQIRVAELRGHLREALCKLYYTIPSASCASLARVRMGIGAIIGTRGYFELDSVTRVLTGQEEEEEDQDQEGAADRTATFDVRVMMKSILYQVEHIQAVIAGKHALEICPC